MPPSIAVLTGRLAAFNAALNYTARDKFRIALIAALHLAALAFLYWSEDGFIAKLTFILTWGLLNFFWLIVLRRPAIAAALSLIFVLLLSLISEFKHAVLWMTVSFVDVMIIDYDAVSFLFSTIPGLTLKTILAAAVLLPLLALLWWIDPFRMRRRVAAAGFAGCLAAVVAVALAFPQEEWEAFIGNSYISKFSRSGVEAVSALLTQGMLESDATVGEQLKLLPAATCEPATRPPHIILVHDESSFDIRAIPGTKVPQHYDRYFQSFDGKARRFIVEGAGGPSWYAEYNVLSGLSARSFGRFAYFVNKIAAGRVERGLPTALKRCGYRTFSLYPAMGAFMSARSYHTSTGVQTFLDRAQMGTNETEFDRFYFDAAAKMIAREHAKAPMFVYVYLAANHFPWDYAWKAEMTPDWKALGNTFLVDEYLRRQTTTMQDYAAFIERLKREFPDERFLLVRYGDHQPDFASQMLEPGLDEAGIAKRVMNYDPRYFTTYYALDTINYRPRNVNSALDTIEGPYLPLIVQEAAGLPLDASFAEQKKILERCNGLFYGCNAGAEARRFNRLLIDAGLIKGL
jgi:hypothetical protein